MVTVVIQSVHEFESRHSSQNPSPTTENITGNSFDHAQSGRDCVEVLMQLIGCGSLDVMLDYQDQRELVSSLVTLPYQFLVGSGSGNLWKQLLNLVIGMNGKGQVQRLERVWLWYYLWSCIRITTTVIPLLERPPFGSKRWRS